MTAAILVLLAVSQPKLPETGKEKPVRHAVPAGRFDPDPVFKEIGVGVLKNGFKDGLGGCSVEPNEETGMWVVEASEDATMCSWVGGAQGVLITLRAGTKVETSPVRAMLVRGEILVSTSSFDFTIDNTLHVVSPRMTVSVGIEEALLVVRSVEGITDILACGGEQAACNKQEFSLMEGEMIALENNGDWWAREESDGTLHYNNHTGCTTAGRGQTELLAVAVLTIFFTTRRWRRRRKSA